MSKTWKWILGIVLVMVLVGAMFAIGFMWQTHRAGGWVMPFDYAQDEPFEQNWNSPMQRDNWNQRVPGDQWNHPMMNTRGFTPFGGFFMLGGLARLVLFFGLLYGAYWLGRRNARIAIDPKPAARIDAPAPLKSPEQDS
jgi:hypothetical protein